jgi:hypothetical protein
MLSVLSVLMTVARRRPWAAAVALVLLLVGTAAAGVVLEAYNHPTAAPGVTAHSESGADSASMAAPVNTTTAIVGNPTLALDTTFSASGATCEFCVILWHWDGTSWARVGKQAYVVTADDVWEDTSLYAGDLVIFDTGVGGATHYEVRHAAPSSGHVGYRAWVGGVATR